MQSFKDFSRDTPQFFGQEDLDELSIEQSPPKTNYELKQRLKRLNAVKLGSGAFGSAYYGPRGGDYVIRSTIHPADRYKLWVTAIKDINNPHTPRIKGIYDFVDNKGFFVILEKLDFDKSKLYRALQINQIVKAANIRLTSASYSEKLDEFLINLNAAFKSYLNGNNSRLFNAFIEYHGNDMKQAYSILQEILSSNKGKPDMFARNWATRPSDSQPVIVDPLL